MSQPFHAPNGYSTSSQTARALEMHGMHVLDEPDTRPMPDDEQLQAAVTAMFAALTENLADTGMEAELEDIAWSLPDIFQRKADRFAKRIDANELKQRDLHDRQDRSEIMSVQLEDATDEGRMLIERRDTTERLRDLSIKAFENLTGSAWRPRTKTSIVSHRNMTAAMIDSRDMRNAERYARTHVLLPKGPCVAFSGGQKYTVRETIYAVMDKTLAKHPTMWVAHSGKHTGADDTLVQWCRDRKVTEVPFVLYGNPNDKSEGFNRNKRMLELNPIGVIVFPGSGLVGNLASTAKAMGIPVMDLQGLADATPKAQAPTVPVIDVPGV